MTNDLTFDSVTPGWMMALVSEDCPYDEYEPRDVLMEPGKCLQALYPDPLDECLCSMENDASSKDPSSRLAFVEENPTRYVSSFPVSVPIQMQSLGTACGDILESVWIHTETFNDQTNISSAVPAQITPYNNGTYDISARVTAPGTYNVQVRMIWSAFVPHEKCRPGCRHNYDAWVNTTAIYNQKVDVVYASRSRRMLDQKALDPRIQNRHCQNMGEILDGRWVTDPTQLIAYDAVKESEPYCRWNLKAVWVPNTCSLKLYHKDEINRALDGKHILTIGDSTTFEVMARLIQLLIGVTGQDYPAHFHNGCFHNNRYFDSTYHCKEPPSARFTFSWDGSADFCGHREGLAGILENPNGLERFKNTTSPEADFIVMGAGVHEISGGMPIQRFDQLVPQAFDTILNITHKLNQESHRDRFIYRTVTPLTHPQIDLGWNDANAGRKWMNYLASKHARDYGFALLDSQRIWEAEDYLGRSNGVERACGDGLHTTGAGCDKGYMEAIIIMHHIMSKTRDQSTP